MYYSESALFKIKFNRLSKIIVTSTVNMTKCAGLFGTVMLQFAASICGMWVSLFGTMMLQIAASICGM
jgi:hypothetical protein